MSQTVEIVRFRVLREHVDPFLASRDGAMAAVRESYPRMTRAQLTQVGGEEWIDIVVWASKDQALAAAAGAMSIPAFAEWAGHITAVISMEHAEVRAAHD